MKESFGKIIANNLRAERNRKGLSQEETAEVLGITRRTYIKYEEDASVVSIKQLAVLSETFGCSMDAFFIGI